MSLLEQIKKLEQLKFDDDGRKTSTGSKSPEPTTPKSQPLKLASKQPVAKGVASQTTNDQLNANGSTSAASSPTLPSATATSTLEETDASTEKKEQVFIETMWYVIVKHKQNAKGEKEEFRRYSLQAAERAPKSRKYNPSQKVIRLVLAYAITHNFKACQLDIDLAHTDVDFVDKNVEYFIDDPRNGIDPEATDLQIHKLKRPLPGLKGAEKLFYGSFTMFLVNKLEFSEFSGAKGVWVYAPQQETKVIVMIEGDDIIICGKTQDDVDWIVSQFQAQYVVTHLGYPLLFGGNLIYYDNNREIVLLDRKALTVYLLEKYKIKHDPSVRTIMAEDFDHQWRTFASKQVLPRAEKGKKTVYYQLLVKELMAIAKSIRPGISREVATLAALELHVNDFLIQAAERAIQYVANSANMRLSLKYDPKTKDGFQPSSVTVVPKHYLDKATITFSADKNGRIDWWAKVIYDFELDPVAFKGRIQREVNEDYKHLLKVDHFLHTGQVLEDVPEVDVPVIIVSDETMNSLKPELR